MKEWIRRHPLSSYFLVAYAVSWSIAVPLALQAQGVITTRLPLALHYLTAFGPAAAAIAIGRLLRPPARPDGRSRSQLFGRSFGWWTVGLVSPLFLFVLARMAAALLGQPVPTWRSLGHVSFLPDLGLAAWGLWFLTSGCGEEAGWRGFALEPLQRRCGPVVGTLILAALWAGWHTPAFFVVETYRTMTVPMIIGGFGLGICAGSIVLSRIAQRTDGSVLAAALWHALYNMTSATAASRGVIVAVTTTCVMLWATVLLIGEARRRTRPSGLLVGRAQ